MTTILQLDDLAYLWALRRLVDVHDDLGREQATLSDAVGMLLRGGWTGVAAEEFGSGWSEWESGCRAVLDGLAAMADAMTWVSAGLHDCDDDQRGAAELIRRRLGSER